MSRKSIKVAVCLPARNEWPSLEKLLPQIAAVNDSWDSVDLHLVVFDDGSNDGTAAHLEKYPTTGFTLSVLRSQIPLGKTPALAAGFRYAREAGVDYIFMMDADGQDDPQYLPEMLERLMLGADVVNGRRSNRKHSLAKRQSSRIFNAVVRLITGLSLLDVNSGLKGFTPDALKYLDTYLYGEMHRVILIVASGAGFRVDEVRVVNRERIAGKTKYGVARGWRGFFDLITFQALRRYQSRPGHLFSGYGSILLVGAVLATLGGLFGSPAGGHLLLNWIVVALIAVGFGMVLLGLGFIAELVLFLSRNPSSRLELVVGPQREASSRAFDPVQKSATDAWGG